MRRLRVFGMPAFWIPIAVLSLASAAWATEQFPNPTPAFVALRDASGAEQVFFTNSSGYLVQNDGWPTVKIAHNRILTGGGHLAYADDSGAIYVDGQHAATTEETDTATLHVDAAGRVYFLRQDNRDDATIDRYDPATGLTESTGRTSKNRGPFAVSADGRVIHRPNNHHSIDGRSLGRQLGAVNGDAFVLGGGGRVFYMKPFTTHEPAHQWYETYEFNATTLEGPFTLRPVQYLSHYAALAVDPALNLWFSTNSGELHFRAFNAATRDYDIAQPTGIYATTFKMDEQGRLHGVSRNTDDGANKDHLFTVVAAADADAAKELENRGYAKAAAIGHGIYRKWTPYVSERPDFGVLSDGNDGEPAFFHFNDSSRTLYRNGVSLGFEIK